MLNFPFIIFSHTYIFHLPFVLQYRQCGICNFQFFTLCSRVVSVLAECTRTYFLRCQCMLDYTVHRCIAFLLCKTFLRIRIYCIHHFPVITFWGNEFVNMNQYHNCHTVCLATCIRRVIVLPIFSSVLANISQFALVCARDRQNLHPRDCCIIADILHRNQFETMFPC